MSERPFDPTLEDCVTCGASVASCNDRGGQCCPDCTHGPRRDNVVPLVPHVRKLLDVTNERGPDAPLFLRDELSKAQKLNDRLLQAHRLSRVSAGVLLSSEELERLMLALACYQEDLEAAIGELSDG